jgi:hypothetical protein
VLAVTGALEIALHRLGHRIDAAGNGFQQSAPADDARKRSNIETAFLQARAYGPLTEFQLIGDGRETSYLFGGMCDAFGKRLRSIDEQAYFGRCRTRIYDQNPLGHANSLYETLEVARYFFDYTQVKQYAQVK